MKERYKMNKRIKTLQSLTDSRLLYEKKLPNFGYFIILTVLGLMITVIIWSIRTPKNYIITSTGIVESSNKNYVMSPYTGTISEIFIEEGDLVNQGDVLLKVKSTDIDLQIMQLQEQRKTYETMIAQYTKLVQSVKDNENYFDSNNADDSLYYSQFEAYKSKVEQNQVDVSTYKAYGYTDDQIESQLIANQAKVTELYYSEIQTVESSLLEAKNQMAALDAQMSALGQGQNEYEILASETGIIHMMSDYDAGMVVQAASAIASISSVQDSYGIIAYLNVSDASRTHVGDKVDIAVAGLPQSVYGTIEGTVKKIDSDLTVSQSTDSSGNVSYFKVYIEPKSDYLISKAGNKVNLSSGMSVETRIRYDEVTYFDYVMEALGVLTR